MSDDTSEIKDEAERKAIEALMLKYDIKRREQGDFGPFDEIEGDFEIKDGHITQLDLSGKNIKRIEGLEQFTQLEDLDLTENQITKIEGLDNLSRLEILHLRGNKITKKEGLENLSKLQTFSLDGNPLSE